MLLLCWFDHFLDSRAEICQIFCWFFGKFKKSKRHSEINWPLAVHNWCWIFNNAFEYFMTWTHIVLRQLDTYNNPLTPTLHSLHLSSAVICALKIVRNVLHWNRNSKGKTLAESAWNIPYLNRKIFLFPYQIFKSCFFCH